MTPAQRIHNQRAAGLRAVFNEESLAEFLHQTYRAGFKALHDTGRNATGHCIDEHDHGFGSCHKKKYFLRRARYLLRDVAWPILVGF